MNKLLALIFTGTLLSCTSPEKDTDLCSDLVSTNKSFEAKNESISINLKTQRAVTNEELIIIIDKQVSSINSFCDILKSALIESDNQKVIESIDNLHSLLDEVRSHHEMRLNKYYLANPIIPEYEITHLEISNLKEYIDNPCSELSTLKVNEIQNQLLSNLYEIALLPRYKFNRIMPVSFAASNEINYGDSLELFTGLIAYDSTDISRIIYWVDDSTRSNKTAIYYEGDGWIRFGGEKGEHQIDGTIEVLEDGVRRKKPWRFHYKVK